MTGTRSNVAKLVGVANHHRRKEDQDGTIAVVSCLEEAAADIKKWRNDVGMHFSRALVIGVHDNATDDNDVFMVEFWQTGMKMVEAIGLCSIGQRRLQQEMGY